MKAVFSQDIMQKNDGDISINDMNIVDILLEDAECDEILVDDFLSGYFYSEIGPVLNKILSKLRLHGTVTISFIDAALISYKLANDTINLEDYNSCLFYKSRKSLVDCFIIQDLVQQAGIEIQTIKNLPDFAKTIIVGKRNA